MERAKVAKGKDRLSSVRQAPVQARKNQEAAARSKGEGTEQANTRSRRKPKEREKIICRYCGNDDLAPSFIKRRDRRCRTCFSKRYGSAARAKRATNKK
jgi:hypothetical protein